MTLLEVEERQGRGSHYFPEQKDVLASNEEDSPGDVGIDVLDEHTLDRILEDEVGCAPARLATLILRSERPGLLNEPN